MDFSAFAFFKCQENAGDNSRTMFHFVRSPRHDSSKNRQAKSAPPSLLSASGGQKIKEDQDRPREVSLEETAGIG